MEPFVQDAVVVGELVNSLLEGGVLGREVLRGLARVVLFQIADLAHPRPDA